MENKILLLETYESVKEYSIKLINGIEQFVLYIDNNEVNEAMKMIVLICDGLDWFLKACKLTEELQQEQIKLEEFNEYFVVINEGLENDDLTLIYDIFKYELLEKIKSWYGFNFQN